MRDLLMLDRRFADVTVRGEPRVPVLGWRANVARFFADPFAGLVRLSRRPERLVAIADRHPAFVCGFGPEINHRLLTDRGSFAAFVTPLRATTEAFALLLDNPFTTVGEAHREHRRVMVPPFHRRRVERYRDALVGLIEAAIGPWRVGDVIEVTDAMQRLTLSAMLAVVFGLDVDGSRRRTEEFRVLLGELLTAIGNPSVIFFPADVPGAPFRRMLRLGERFVAEVSALVEERRRSPREDVLSELLAGDSRSPVGQLFSLLTAGHETTYAALSWVLLLLGSHPRVLADLQDELRGALKGDAPGLDQLAGLPLLDRVVKESLRVLPTAPYGARLALEDVELEGHRLPKGAVIIYSHYVTHHLPEVFPAPRRFDPGRWATIDPSPYEYLPFGAGPRVCVGAAFATLELKLTLACLLQRFSPELVPGSRVDCQLRITLRPQPGLRMVLRPVGEGRAVPMQGTVHEAVALPGGW
jgi:cytochrome P450